MNSPVAFKLAGQVFEQLRADGETLEGAMREADRTLQAAKGKEPTTPGAVGSTPAFAHGVLADVASRYRVTVDAMQLRGGALKVVAARGEAATILMRLGLTPNQVGRLLRRDRYAATAAARKFDERLKVEPVLQARVDQFVDALRVDLAAQGQPERRPPVRAARPQADVEAEATGGGV